MPCCTSNRVPARHTWPALSYCSIARSTARSRSASSRMTVGLLPPSSNEQGMRFSAAARATAFAVGTEPVKQMRETSGFSVSGAPASMPKPCTTLKTPAGRPASWASCAKYEAVSGAHSGGLSTTVSPDASAGPMRQVASMSGAFHGVMMTATPDGSQVTWLECPRVSNWGCLRSFIAKSAK